MNSEQRLRLKRGASRQMKAQVWHCKMCGRGQVGGKKTFDTGGEIILFKRCRYCL